MEMIESKGLVIFFVIVLCLTIIGSINTKKYDESNSNKENYIIMNAK